jgi:hypothetical protein
MKKRFTTLPSGVVDTLTLWIRSSRSDRICVTSETSTRGVKIMMRIQFGTNTKAGQQSMFLTVQQPLAVVREELEEVELRGPWWVDVVVERYVVRRRAHGH